MGRATITKTDDVNYFEFDEYVAINGVMGGSGNDTLTGNDSFNTLRGGAGNNTLDGGAEFDTAIYNTAQQSIKVLMAEDGVAFSFANGFGGTDTLVNIEGIGGTKYDDYLQGNSSNNYFRGDNGFDYIDGGAGQDWADYGSAEKAVNITLAETGQTIVADDGQRVCPCCSSAASASASTNSFSNVTTSTNDASSSNESGSFQSPMTVRVARRLAGNSGCRSKITTAQPNCAAACAVIRASWPPPMMPRVGNGGAKPPRCGSRAASGGLMHWLFIKL